MSDTKAIYEEYSEIHHYTNQAGLKGILESQSVHATHYAFLNDYQEMRSFRFRLEQLIVVKATEMYRNLEKDPSIKRKMDAEGGATELANHDAAGTMDAIFRVTFGLDGGTKFLQPFIASFCGHKEKYEQDNGLLSQWRYYGKDSGYALVFDAKAINELRKEEMQRYHHDVSAMGGAFYDTSDEAFTQEYSGLAEAIHTDLPKLLKGAQASYPDLNKQFMQGVIRYKHPAFHEEKEIRLVVSPTDHKLLDESGKKLKAKLRKEIHYRPNMSPYMALFEDKDLKLPITRIIIGPHADRELRKRKLEAYLDIRGLKIPVTCSETPAAL